MRGPLEVPSTVSGVISDDRIRVMVNTRSETPEGETGWACTLDKRKVLVSGACLHLFCPGTRGGEEIGIVLEGQGQGRKEGRREVRQKKLC